MRFPGEHLTFPRREMAFPQCISLFFVGKCDFLGAALGSEVTAPSTSQKSDSLIGIRRDAVAGERQIMHDAGQEAFRIFRKKNRNPDWPMQSLVWQGRNRFS